MSKEFKDHFSAQSDLYLKYRPLYPKGLYLYLSGLCKQNKLAWDCGTGNGQAAIGLSEFFAKVIATDPSKQQINNAIQQKGIEYRIEKAENSSLANKSADIITVSNALHWFDFEKFYSEVTRVLKPDGVIAAWSFAKSKVNKDVDKLINKYHDQTLGEYWLPENKMVEDAYKDLPFPFRHIDVPKFYIEKNMDLSTCIAYINTWSATQRFIRRNKYNPTEALEEELLSVWKNPLNEKAFKWELTLKVGYLR